MCPWSSLLGLQANVQQGIKRGHIPSHNTSTLDKLACLEARGPSVLSDSGSGKALDITFQGYSGYFHSEAQWIGPAINIKSLLLPLAKKEVLMATRSSQLTKKSSQLLTQASRV